MVISRFFLIMNQSYESTNKTSVATLPTALIGSSGNHHTTKYSESGVTGPDLTANFNNFTTSLR